MSQSQIPSTRVISPTPTPKESEDGQDGYFGPTTRSAMRRAEAAEGTKTEEDERSRLRNRSTNRRRASGTVATPKPTVNKPAAAKSEPLVSNGGPASLSPTSFWNYQDFSRSPSPHLIPSHKAFRSFVHRHEIPRKALHVSIGFFTLHLYSRGFQTSAIHPWLLGALIPIVSVDVLRHNSSSFNRFYVRVLGAFMRESEVNDKYNGVIFYLLGAWISMRFFPKDVAVMGVLLLSWCDTAASTIGRLYGRYTPRIRKGKSFAGSSAAALVGAMTALIWWGVFVPSYYGFEDGFMFKGELHLPPVIFKSLGIGVPAAPALTGWASLGVLSLWTGLVASLSEVVDLFGIDDNLTIPALSGIGLWGFLKVFG